MTIDMNHGVNSFKGVYQDCVGSVGGAYAISPQIAAPDQESYEEVSEASSWSTF